MNSGACQTARYTDDIAQVKAIVGEAAQVLSGEDMQRPTMAETLPGPCRRMRPSSFWTKPRPALTRRDEKELTEAVSELTHNKTVIMIAHRLKTVRNADRISVVEHGEIVQQGAHDELVAAQRWIAKATTTVNIPQKYWTAFVL